MKCEINLEELKTLLTGKYKAKEIGWDEILLFGRYFGFKKYDIFSLTEAEMTNTNNRFYLIDNREVLEKYSTLDLGEYLTEYILVVLGLDGTATAVEDIFFRVPHRIELSSDIDALDGLFQERKRAAKEKEKKAKQKRRKKDLKKELRRIWKDVLLKVAIFLAIFCVIMPFFPSAKRVFKTAVKSIVELKAETESVETVYGAAIVVDKDGTLVTNAHLITYTHLGEEKTFEKYSIRFSTEEEYQNVQLIKYDLEKDIAVLQCQEKKGGYKPIKIGKSEKITFGDKVYAIGNGRNYGLSITEGLVSIPKLHVEYKGIKREVIQCDITITAGDSGGALLDRRGRLLGITTFRMRDVSGDIAYGLAYCIPIENVMNFIES